MVGRDWYSNPNYYWVANTGATIDVTHDGGNRWWYRGMVLLDINPWMGRTLDPNSVTFHFYSNGFSGTQLQYANNIEPTLLTGYGQASGSFVATLGATTGWLDYDVTSLVQSSIDAHYRYVGLIFNATSNYGGGSTGTVEGGQAAFLADGAIPEPVSAALVGFGLIAGLWMVRRRRG